MQAAPEVPVVAELLDDHPCLQGYQMPNFLVMADMQAAEQVALEEPAAAAAKDQDSHPWANQVVVVALVVVLVDFLVAAAAAADQDCPEVDDLTLSDHQVPLTLAATNHHQEVDCHCHLDCDHHCPEVVQGCCHC